jgi:hypothetical protein
VVTHINPDDRDRASLWNVGSLPSTDAAECPREFYNSNQGLWKITMHCSMISNFGILKKRMWLTCKVQYNKINMRICCFNNLMTAFNMYKDGDVLSTKHRAMGHGGIIPYILTLCYKCMQLLFISMGKMMSLNCSHQQAYCSSPRWYMSMESQVGILTGKNQKKLGEKPVPVPLCPPQIPYRLTQARTWAWAIHVHISSMHNTTSENWNK